MLSDAIWAWACCRQIAMDFVRVIRIARGVVAVVAACRQVIQLVNILQRQQLLTPVQTRRTRKRWTCLQRKHTCGYSRGTLRVLSISQGITNSVNSWPGEILKPRARNRAQETGGPSADVSLLTCNSFALFESNWLWLRLFFCVCQSILKLRFKDRETTCKRI